MLISYRGALCAALALGILSSAAKADSLGIVPADYPIDLFANFISPVHYDYDSGTQIGTLTVGAAAGGGFGMTTSIRTTLAGSPVALATMGDFGLTASFQVNGSSFTILSGSLLATGGITAGDPVSDIFKSNTLQQFGFSSAGGVNHLEFIFAPGTGVYGGNGPIGVVLHSQGSAFSLTSDYNPTTLATADIVAVPLPAAALSGLSALACLPLLKLRRKH